MGTFKKKASTSTTSKTSKTSSRKKAGSTKASPKVDTKTAEKVDVGTKGRKSKAVELTGKTLTSAINRTKELLKLDSAALLKICRDKKISLTEAQKNKLSSPRRKIVMNEYGCSDPFFKKNVLAEARKES